jgi:hypothetical protein
MVSDTFLRYVDHLSGFSYVDTLKTKSAEEVGVKLSQDIVNCCDTRVVAVR